VAVILDIAPGTLKLVGLPSSFQRIVMNLVGNSLKYAQSGFIRIKLAIQTTCNDTDEYVEQDSNVAMVELKVHDTGRGISEQFSKTKLFSAFSQESTLAPGAGKLCL
jgi:signal transduction histidine kinase